jgi:hypothetical protein
MFRRIWKSVQWTGQSVRRLAASRLFARKQDTPQRQAAEQSGARVSSRDLDLEVMDEAIRRYPGQVQNQEAFWREQRGKSRASFFRCKRLFAATRGDVSGEHAEEDHGDKEATNS